MAENVFLFVPNLIGYARITLAFISFYFMSTRYVVAACCYILSAFLDAFDGYASRVFNQGSRLGALLDQLTDRCTIVCMMATLCMFYPRYSFLFLSHMAIDIASHWMHGQVSLMTGCKSHKDMDANGNPIMMLYYSNRTFLFSLCAGNELFHCMLYLLHFTPGPIVTLGPLSFGLWKWLCLLTAPVAAGKAVICVIQLFCACGKIAALDTEERQKALK